MNDNLLGKRSKNSKFWMEEEQITTPRLMDMDDLKKTIKHSTHPHPLKLTQHDPANTYGYSFLKCYCCEFIYYGSRKSLRVCSGENFMYACTELECNPYGIELIGTNPNLAYLCVSCAEMGERVENNALHPHHQRLKLKRSTGPKCSACCNWMFSPFSYQCEEEKCNFEMHIKCAHSLEPTLSLPSHSHLLALIVHDYPYTEVLNCESCHFEIPYPWAFARCVPCNLNYHISCLRVDYCLPELVMDVQRHPQHPLSLFRTNYYWTCDVCSKNKRDWPNVQIYACLDCNNFTAHLSCIFLSSLPCPFSNLITNVVAADVLIKDGPMHENMTCQSCKKCIPDNGVPVYGCQYCHLFIHETCIRRAMVDDRVKETLIFSHPGYDQKHDDPLVLVFVHGADGIRCACCSKYGIGFMFRKEDDESFVLDLECMLVVPSLDLIGHDHPVILLQGNNTTRNSYLRCIPCQEDFKITESSCRLPYTLLHECHLHLLTLVSNVVDDNTEQCYCDVCEDKRDPNEYIYYCAKCKFEAHIGCVRLEVLGPGSNKQKDVQFGTLQQNDQKEKKKIKVKDVFCLKEELLLSWTHSCKELNDIFQAFSEMTWENSVCENPYINDFSNKTLYSEKPFKEFRERLNSTSTNALEKMRSTLENLRNEEVVRVDKYLVPLNFDEVLETLFDKYGDFSAKCTYSQEVTQYLFVGICKILQNMCNIEIVRVTESLLMEWWTWIAMGKAAGFQIQFALEGWKRVVLAHFGLEADKYAIGKLRTARQQIKELPEEIEKLERELDEKRRRLKEARIEENYLREEVFRVKKSPMMKKCLKEAEDLACYTAGETFLPPSH